MREILGFESARKVSIVKGGNILNLASNLRRVVLWLSYPVPVPKYMVEVLYYDAAGAGGTVCIVFSVEAAGQVIVIASHTGKGHDQVAFDRKFGSALNKPRVF